MRAECEWTAEQVRLAQWTELENMLRAGAYVLSRRSHPIVLVKQGHIFLLGRLEGQSGQQ